MSPAMWEGPGVRVSSPGKHEAGAPWPTCSCHLCRRARRHEVADGWREAVRRMRERAGRTLEAPPPPPKLRPIRERIYGELRELEEERPDRDIRLPWGDHR